MKVGVTEVEVTNKFFRWTSGMVIDADGAHHAYAPKGRGLDALDYLANAGSTEKGWYGLVTNEITGEPYIQTDKDPAPGYYVSPTSLADRSKPLRDPRRYVNSEEVPYIAVPPEITHAGIKMGDVCWVTYNGLASEAIVADVGPRNKIGEGSIFLAKALSIPPSPKNGGVEKGVTYTIYRGTSLGWPRTVDAILAQVRSLLGDE